MRETVHIGVRYSDYLMAVEGLPAPPSDLRVRLDGGVARLSWQGNAPDADGYEVEYRRSEQGTSSYRESLIRVEGRSSATVPLASTAPGMSHRYRVRAVKGETRSLRSDAWTDLPASAREYTVTGLDNGTEYTFAARAAAGPDPGPAATAAATPGAPPEASFRLDIPYDEELCRALTGTPVSFVDTSEGNVAERRWSFGDGDGSDLLSPTHAWSAPGFYAVTLTVSYGLHPDSATRTVLVESALPAGSCRADDETLCLRDSRFAGRMEWWTASGVSVAARVVHAGTNEAGIFRFADPENRETLIKVLDGCAINGRVWVLGASTTDPGYRIQVTDTVAGESRPYGNEPGRPAPAMVYTETFAYCAADAGAR